MKNLKLKCKQCGRGKLKNKFDKCYECRQPTEKPCKHKWKVYDKDWDSEYKQCLKCKEISRVDATEKPMEDNAEHPLYINDGSHMINIDLTISMAIQEYKQKLIKRLGKELEPKLHEFAFKVKGKDIGFKEAKLSRELLDEVEAVIREEGI